MKYTNVALKDKIMEMYPEISQHHIAVGLDFAKDKDAYVVHFIRNSHTLQTYVDRSDADECMNDIKCVHLGVKIGEFIRNFETREH